MAFVAAVVCEVDLSLALACLVLVVLVLVSLCCLVCRKPDDVDDVDEMNLWMKLRPREKDDDE